jgi:hypothetical protein
MPKLQISDDMVNAAPGSSTECDLAFFDCIANNVCSDCFFEMSTNSIDWAGVTQNTDCSTVISTLQTNGYCKAVTLSNQDVFCKTFRSCVYFDDTPSSLDCDSLTECNWPGIHTSFIGDGVCHDLFFNGCYNSAICNFDGGDCCKDTCKPKEGAYLECGSDGFSCRDPSSSECDPTLTLKCPPSSYKKPADNNDDVPPKCISGQSLYRILMYDSFGDGWEQTEMKIVDNALPASTPIFKGGLASGAEGTAYVCLSTTPTCYNVNVTGGNWGREASWFVRGYVEGSPAIASGSGAMNCTFNVAGSTLCENTCLGRSNADPSNDPEYKDFKSMEKCIEDKCMIQVSACSADPTCLKCFQSSVPDYCFSIETFLSVNDCAMCKCTDLANATGSMSDFCYWKLVPDIIVPPTPKDGSKGDQAKPCSPAETLSGTTALMNFSKCMNYDQNPMMMTDFDSNNFGDLDTFEACAHAYVSAKDHQGRTALGCLQILVNAIDEKAKPGEPTQVIAQLAKLLYRDGINFCDCAKEASINSPLCPSFYNFKTLLYESVDACMALDEIDCDAWDEFQKPCQTNLQSKFGSINLAAREQCEYLESNCGGAGPFPSFRHLDCQTEISPSSWDFYKQYKSACVDKSVPVPAPTEPPVAPNVKPPTPYEAVKPTNIKPKKGGTPTADVSPTNKKPSYKSPDQKKSHWFRNTVLILLFAGVGYYFYKKQSDGFNFVRYRRMTNFSANRGAFGMDDGDMFTGLSLESSTNFEPPSLPPMPNNGGYGA